MLESRTDCWKKKPPYCITANVNFFFFGKAANVNFYKLILRKDTFISFLCLPTSVEFGAQLAVYAANGPNSKVLLVLKGK